MSPIAIKIERLLFFLPISLEVQYTSSFNELNFLRTEKLIKLLNSKEHRCGLFLTKRIQLSSLSVDEKRSN